MLWICGLKHRIDRMMNTDASKEKLLKDYEHLKQRKTLYIR